MAVFSEEPLIKEALQYIDRAIGGVHTLHCGPFDENVESVMNDLLAAISRLGAFNPATAQPARPAPDEGSRFD